MKDRDVLFHEKWLGLAQPIEGLVFSVPVLGDAQIAPEVRPELSVAFEEHLALDDEPRIRDLATFFRDFLGFAQSGMLVARAQLPSELSFYASEGGQEIRPSFALGRGPFASDDLFAGLEEPPLAAAGHATAAAPTTPWFALLWDLTESGKDLDLDEPEAVTGPWRYSPTAKLERLLRHVGVPIGILFNGRHLRLVYAPAGETTAHLTFRVEHLRRPDGRPLLAALDLLLHARRAYGASPQHTLEGLLAESRRRQADVTDELAKQVFEAVEILVAGFESAAARDTTGGRLDWLRAALETEGDHFYQGVLSIVLRLVFLLYSEDQGLLPVEHPTYAEHLSLFGLHARLEHDAGAHPESMHHRFGAYGQLLSLFRAVFFGVKHGGLELPPRRGRLFDPNAYPFLEGGQPDWTAAVVDPEARAAAYPPSIDDGAIYRVLHRLVVFEGQRLSYRTLDVEQIGSIYESLMGYHVLRLTSAAARVGKYGVWVEIDALRTMSTADRAHFLKDICGMNSGPIAALEGVLRECGVDEVAALAALSDHAIGRRVDVLRHRASTGRLVLQPGEERRRTGSHYTPRALTERVVRHTLEPLLACLGEARTCEQILQLKICDPAMGSGAFLVSICRELASDIVAAWTRGGELAGVIEQHGDAHLHARRLVAQKCIYGVDKNAAAVELAKLSLWLITLSKQLPFTFVDHALRHGDSLVGLDFKQIEAFHWAPPGQVETCRILLREALDQAVTLRQQILELADHDDPIAQAEKRRLFEFAQQAINRVRVVADVCVGAFFAESKGAAREKERQRRLLLVERWLGGDAEAGTEIESLASKVRRELAPFHWWIEFPEVFFDERPDPLQGGAKNGAAFMEAVVGNPPFLGQAELSGNLGAAYRDWLFALHPGVEGKSNIVAHFFRRAASLLGNHGTIGMVSTDKIAQGETREGSLTYLLATGYVIYDAVPRMLWPGAANVTVATVHLAIGRPSAGTRVLLNGQPVDALTSYLRSGRERSDPQPLREDAPICFLGCKIGGQGFTLAPEQARTFVEKDPRNARIIRPYMGGEQLNSDPNLDFERSVIDFGQMSLEEAAAWPDLLQIVEKDVKPQREKSNRDAHKKYWWRYAEVQPAMRAAVAKLTRCLAIGTDPSHICFAFQPTDRLLNHKICVIALDSFTAFAVLQSRVHVAWALLHGRTTGAAATPAYSPSRCLDTFPFPVSDPRSTLPALESVGRRLYDARARFMVETQQGLTKTYNAVKNPSSDDAGILELRCLHEEMDRAVLAAYGWVNTVVPPYCPVTEADRQALHAFEDHVIDRLYALNAERAREENRLGLVTKRGPRANDGEAVDLDEEIPAKTTRRKKTASAKKSAKDQGKLFE